MTTIADNFVPQYNGGSSPGATGSLSARAAGASGTTQLSSSKSGRQARWSRPRGFTLVEVMVSIAVALLLILGINQVFRATAQVTGGGQAMTTASQYARTVKTAITNDVRSAAWQDAPVLIIRGEQQYAFRSANDQQGAPDPTNAATDPLFPGGSVPAYFVNGRSHRIDRLGFFARSNFERQTAPGDPSPAYTVYATAPEAWIWYGHLRLPSNATLSQSFPSAWKTGLYFDPGEPSSNGGTNDNNFYSSDWTLGRMAILLGGLGVNTQAQNADALRVGAPIQAPVFLQPLTYDTKAANPSNDAEELSLHDIAATDISDYIATLYQTVTSPTVPPSADQLNWFYWLIGCRYQPNLIEDHRFCAAPFVPAGPLDKNNPAVKGRVNAYSLGWTAPCIARGCSSFIVEFAGNYTTQTNDPGQPDDGTITAGTPDANPDHIDFINVPLLVTKPGGGTVTTYNRQIRWYGYPRATAQPRTNGLGQMQIDDVLPLRDVLTFYGFLPTGGIPFEHFPTGFPNFPYNGTTLGTISDRSYTCAWGPYKAGSNPAYGLPTLLRITVFFDDPNGHLTDAQSYEYIIDLRQ